MIGVFDSGAGGMLAVEEIRRLMPRLDIAFFADRENAPYGEKSKEEILSITKENIDLLRSLRVDKILIACCTASTVYSCLPEEYKNDVIPIIAPTARAALNKTKNKRIGVLATDATVKSRAFTKEIIKISPEAIVLEVAAQRLVQMAEEHRTERKIIKDYLSGFKDTGIDTLILGCTHFPLFYEYISEVLEGVSLISSAKVCALQLLKEVNNEGEGKILYPTKNK
jgi:glutamate racemase